MQSPKAVLESILSNRFLLFLSFLLPLGVLYYPSWQAGFMSDFLGMFLDVDRLPFADFINRSHAQVKSFYQFTQLQMYLFIRLFGTSFLPWFAITMILHAVNGMLAFRFFRALFQDFGLQRAALIAFTGTLLFLFNPNITEVTVWKGGYHYLTGVLMQLLILGWCRGYLLEQKPRFALYAVLLFAVSIFTLEIFYVTPALALFLIAGYYRKGLIDTARARRALIVFFLPLVLLFVTHLLMFRLVYGSWVAHYGVTSTFTMSVAEMLPRLGKYLAYILILAGHYPEKARMAVYGFVSQPAFYITIPALAVLFFGYVLLRFRQLKPATQLAAFLTAAAVCCLVLVVPIYFDDLFSLYNSRRCYQLGLFLYMLLALLIFRLGGNTRPAWAVYGFFLFACLVFTGRKVFHWRSAARVQYSILENFRHQQASHVLLLNLPTYFQDIRIMPASDYGEFAEQLNVFRHPPIQGKLYEVSSYNMRHSWNGAHVTVLDSNTLKVTLNQWGTWWMYNYVGAGDYETDLYQVKMTDPGHEYQLILKQRPPGMAILFHQGTQWKAVDLTKVGVEQW